MADAARPERPNPARMIEQAALDVVRYWLGSDGEFRDTTDGNGPDFEIHYRSGRTAVGEVGWHPDPERMRMRAAMLKTETPQLIRLSPGLGQWGVGLVKGANIKELDRGIRDLVQRLVSDGRTSLVAAYERPSSSLGRLARQVGVNYIRRLRQSRTDEALYFLPGGGGVVPDDPELIVGWINAMFADQRYQDAWQKLSHLAADERHVFFVAGSATDFGVQQVLMDVDRRLPSFDPVLPASLTHIWAMGEYGVQGAAVWYGGGWHYAARPPALNF